MSFTFRIRRHLSQCGPNITQPSCVIKQRAGRPRCISLASADRPCLIPWNFLFYLASQTASMCLEALQILAGEDCMKRWERGPYAKGPPMYVRDSFDHEHHVSLASFHLTYIDSPKTSLVPWDTQQGSMLQCQW